MEMHKLKVLIVSIISFVHVLYKSVFAPMNLNMLALELATDFRVIIGHGGICILRYETVCGLRTDRCYCNRDITDVQRRFRQHRMSLIRKQNPSNIRGAELRDWGTILFPSGIMSNVALDLKITVFIYAYYAIYRI